MFDVPRPASSVAERGDYIQPNLGHGLRIWWAFYWRTVLSSMAVAAGVDYLMLRRFSHGPATVFISTYGAYLLYYLAAFFMIAYILRKNFRRFRIVLLSNRGGEGATPLPRTLQRTARVWWAFSWRAVIYRIIAAVAVMFPLGWTMGFISALLPGPVASALINLVVQMVLDAVVGMFVIYSNILDEAISDFQVTLSPRTASTSSLAAAAVPEG